MKKTIFLLLGVLVSTISFATEITSGQKLQCAYKAFDDPNKEALATGVQSATVDSPDFEGSNVRARVEMNSAVLDKNFIVIGGLFKDPSLPKDTLRITVQVLNEEGRAAFVGVEGLQADQTTRSTLVLFAGKENKRPVWIEAKCTVVD